MSSKIRAKKHIDILDKTHYFIPDIYTYLLCTIGEFRVLIWGHASLQGYNCIPMADKVISNMESAENSTKNLSERCSKRAF